MQVTIEPSTVSGVASAPPSKSYTHRAVLAAGYSQQTVVRGALSSADTRATMRAVEAFGGSVIERPSDGALEITGFDATPLPPEDVINCENSGTTMRLMTAAAALAEGTTVLTGDDSLRSRPHGPLLEAIDDLGGSADSTRGNGQAPLVVRGPLEKQSVSLPGDVSSQFITALLMAGAVTEDGIEIEVTTELKSAPYVDITLEVLSEFSVAARQTNDGFAVDGGQRYTPRNGEYTVPGDFSSISYLLAAGLLGAPEGPHSPPVRIAGAFPSAQGDTAIVDIAERMGGDVDWNRETGELIAGRSALEGVEVDVGDTPDLLPTIAVMGAFADGSTQIRNCEHVRYKETDRVSAMADALDTLGAVVEEQQDVLTIHGGESTLEGGSVDGRGDHRIVMSLAVAGLRAAGETTIEGAEHVAVSFPDVFDVLYDLGAMIER